MSGESAGANMRIVLSNASKKWGGLHQVTDLLATGLAARSHEVLLMCRPGSMLEQRMTGRMPLAPVLRGADFSPIALRRVWRILRRFRPDVVVEMTDKGLRLTGLATRALRIPLLVRRANDDPLRPGLHGALYYELLPDAIVTASRATRETLLSSAPRLSRKPFHIIANALPAAEAPPEDNESVIGPGGEPTFLFVGRIEERKGVQDLLDAWPAVARQLPNARLVWVGDGPLAEKVRELSERDDSVQLLGYRRNASALMSTADVVVMPSHWEGFGFVAAEAMRAGVAFVGTNTSSLPELVEHGVDGLLVPPRDPPALAAAMIAVGKDPELRARMGAAAQKRSREEFAPEQMIDRWERLLQQYADGSRS